MCQSLCQNAEHVVMKDTENLKELQSYNPAGNTAQKINYILKPLYRNTAGAMGLKGKNIKPDLKRGQDGFSTQWSLKARIKSVRPRR